MKKNFLLLLFLLAVGINVMADDCVPVTTYPATAEFSFEGFWPQGAIPFEFSVSSTKQVYFSQGNLQFCANPEEGPKKHLVASNDSLNGIWRFALNQWDIIGATNASASSTYTGWIDLFGFGTSGWNSGATCYEPWRPQSSDAHNTYFLQYSLQVNYKFADWGVYNSISNGGNDTCKWRTLNFDEWYYLLKTRINAENKVGYAKIHDMKGIIILPDNWILPSGLTFNPTNTNIRNDYNDESWERMEVAGAVFLPIAGRRHGTENYTDASVGWYYSSTHYNGSNGDVRILKFSDTYVDPEVVYYSDNALSVRLVVDVEE